MKMLQKLATKIILPSCMGLVCFITGWSWGSIRYVDSRYPGFQSILDGNPDAFAFSLPYDRLQTESGVCSVISHYSTIFRKIDNSDVFDSLTNNIHSLESFWKSVDCNNSSSSGSSKYVLYLVSDNHSGVLQPKFIAYGFDGKKADVGTILENTK